LSFDPIFPITMPILFACTTCRVTMVEAGGNAAGWSIFVLLMVILPVLCGTVFFMFRIARRERQHLDPELVDDYLPEIQR
jgi:hypothetical protein